MKKHILLLLTIGFILSTALTYAQCSKEIKIPETNIQIKVYEGIYQGAKTLVIQLNNGKIPINAPADRLSLCADALNQNKVFKCKQISPGKYIVTEPVTTEEGVFTLNISGDKTINNIEINFKTKPEKSQE